MGLVIQLLAMVMPLREADLGSVCMEGKEARRHADQRTRDGVKGNQSIVAQALCVCVRGARACVRVARVLILCIRLRGKMDVNVRNRSIAYVDN